MGNHKNCTQKSLGMFWLQNRVIRVWFSTLPSSVVFRPEKFAKIRSKHFLAAVTRNYKKCTPNNVGSAPVLSSLAKVVKIRLYNFKSYRRKMIRTVPQIVWVWLWYKTKSLRPSFQLSLLGACSSGVRARKFCKNLTETFLVVSVGCKIESSGPRFQLCLLRWCPGLEKLSKLDRNIFSDVMARNDKNCIPTSMARFWVKTWVIGAWFSTVPASDLLLWCPVQEMSSKFDRKFFLPYWLKIIRTAPKQCGLKTKSSGPNFQHWLLATYSSRVQGWKSRQNLTKIFFSCTDEKW